MGRNLAGRGITGWIPLHDVNVVNGCMHFMTAATVGVCRRTGV